MLQKLHRIFGSFVKTLSKFSVFIVSIADFEKVNVSWKTLYLLNYCTSFKATLANIQLLKVDNGDTRTMCKIC